MRRWLWHLTAVYNWAVRKIELDAANRVFHSRYDLEALITGHSVKVGVPAIVIGDTVRTAHDAWQRCFKRLARQPRLKGRRNRLNSIPNRLKLKAPTNRRIKFVGLGPLKFHKRDIPAGAIKCSRIVRRASGWYLCLCIAAEPNVIPAVDAREVGIDPGFTSLLTLSTGEKIGITPADQALIAAAPDLLAAMKRIQALDLKKDERGRDDFYSGPDRFFQAWNIANDAVRRVDSHEE